MIRTAGLADIPIIQQLAQATWPATFKEILTPAQIEYMLEMMYSTESLTEQFSSLQHVYLLWYDAGGEPRAYVSYQLDYLPRVAKIHKLYVLPEGQKQGIGKALIDAVAARAVAHRQTRLRLDVNYQNRAIGFYERMGFVKIDEATTDIGEGFLMEDYIFEIGL